LELEFKNMQSISVRSIPLNTCHKYITRASIQDHYVHEFLHVDFPRRIDYYCNWLRNNLNDDRILVLTLFSDEARFHMSGNINS
jgi:hypothetical protein